MRTGIESRSLLDEVMPRCDLSEFHETWVPSSPAIAARATRGVTPSEIRLFTPLMAVRRLPSLVRRERRPIELSLPLLEGFRRYGFTVLAENPDSEVVMGAIGRFWSLTRNEPVTGIDGAADFVAFEEPRYAKAAVNLSVIPEGSGARITTETRIVGTDDEATRLFRRYWFVIRLGSGAIRRSWLSAIRRRAGRESPGAPDMPAT